MHRKSFFTLVFSALLVFALIASQGCGGSSSNKFNDGSGGGNSEGGVTVGGKVILDDDDFDIDDDSEPDFLDFDGVSVTRMNSSSVDVQVPAMILFNELKELGGTDEPDAITVNLQAGTEYTFEFSKNFADPIESILPSIEILDSNGQPVSFMSENEMTSSSEIPSDRIQLSVYPEDKPSIICFTFTPSVTGKYTVRISRANLSAIKEDDDEASASEGDISCILFIYKELRNDKGEPGYYMHFRFADDYGNTTETVDISSVIEMRKLFLELRPEYLKDCFNLNLAEEEFTPEEFAELYSWIKRLQEYHGVFEIDVSDDDMNVSSASRVRPSATTNLNSTGSNIKTRMSGIPYRDIYTLGSGWFGLTGYDATGSAIKNFTLPVPKVKSVTSTYKSDFVSSQQEQEKFSNTTFDASFSKSGFGLDASVSSMSSYKFGLTSTTLVIHYDERETSPRILDDEEYQLTEAAEVQLGIRTPGAGSPSVQNPGYTNFRNLYGDYFVAGYTYGGTYDAFISITTETTEQLSQVKTKLRAKYQSLDTNDTQAAATLANETKEILNRYNASVSIEIKTTGSSANPTPTLPKGKNNVESIGDILSELIRFRAELSKQTPEQFAPFSVYLKRYSVLKPVLAKMNAEGNDGTVPIAPATATMIQEINRALISLGGHHQVIAGLDNSKIDSAVRDDYDMKYKRIVDTIETNPRFYNDADQVKSTLEDIDKLSKELKAIGDRYVFYKMLIAAQKHESSMYDKYKAYEDDASDDNTHHQPFGSNGGGSTGYKEFFVSTAVTADINAGKSATLDGRQSYKAAGRRYWGTSEHNMANVSASYTAKTSAGGYDALFCYVSVEAENKTDRHRRFQNHPVVGKSSLDFDFTSGYSRDATWLVKYQTMQFTKEKYPFFGLER